MSGGWLIAGMAVAALLAWAGAALIRRWAEAFGLVQAPNERSSHRRPTPTGGGAAIAAGTLAGLALAPAGPWLWVLMVPGVLLAAVGLGDDRREIALWIRLTAQIAAVIALLLIAGALPDGMAGSLIGVVSVIVLVGWINAFNFMDGTDGLAGGQAVFIGLGAAALLALGGAGTESGALWLALTLAAASAGFLVHNRPPARLFMGDAGSYFLGFATGTLAVMTVVSGTLTAAAWLILAATFVADSGVTLARRALGGEPILSAHRSHAYQLLARRWNSHGRVAAVAAALNVAWLWPLALAASAWPAAGWILVGVAYLPMIAAVLWFGSGRPGPP